MEVLAFVRFFISSAWRFFTETPVPGCDFSVAALLVGLFLADLGLRFLFMMLGLTAPMGDILHLAEWRKNNERSERKIGF